jgi:hypothetical protein
MKRYTLLAIILYLATEAFCQRSMNDTVFGTDQFLFQPKKFDYHLTIGSQFTSVSGFGSGLNTYVTPGFSYNINTRLKIGGGISIIQTNYFNARSYLQEQQNYSTNGNFTSAMIFVDGQYIVNKHLTISGSAYKVLPLNNDPLPYNPFNPVSSTGAKGINFNIGYKVGDHINFEAGFHYSDGANPFYRDPFNTNPFVPGTCGMTPSFGIPRW